MHLNKTARKLLIYALAATGYFLLGIAGLQLAIPPGYSSVIFPAAGLGFIFVLIGGTRLLPSIWLGSFALNLWLAYNSSSLVAATLFVAALLGIGASLQAWGASYLVKTFGRINWRELTSPKDIALFLAFSGPIASLISTTWGNISLYTLDIISHEQLFASWAYWWLGDSTGVITIAPLLLTFLFLRDKAWAQRKTHVLLPITIALISAIFLFFYMSEKESNEATMKLDDVGENIADTLIAKLIIYREATASIKTLKQMRPDLSYDEFQAFTAPLLDRHKDLQALGFNKYVTSQEREQFEATLAQQFKQAGITITERNSAGKMVKAQNRDWYTPVNFIAPLAGNEQALAYDIASDDSRLEALNKAIRTHEEVITAPIRLVQESGSSNGLLLINPVIDQDNENLDGFSVAVIRIENIMHSLLASQVAQGLKITIRDIDEKLGNGLLYTSDTQQSSRYSDLIWQKELEIAQRDWLLTVTPSKQYLSQFTSYLPWKVLLVALWLIALLQTLLLSITGQHYHDSQKIKEQNKTLELLAHHDSLTGLPNRALFSDRFQQAIALNKRNKSLLAIGFLDLDKFKPVNDTYGHDIGDQLLINVAKRIQLVLRENDTVCRLGGDEFTLLIGSLNSVGECEDILNRLIDVLAEPFSIETHTIEISGSCGVTLYPNDEADLETLLQHADQAMYHAKSSGRNHFEIFKFGAGAS